MITIQIWDEQQGTVLQLQVPVDEFIENVKALIEAQFGTPMASQQLYNGTILLRNENTLASYGLGNMDMIRMITSTPQVVFNEMDPDHQKAIEEAIRQRLVQESYESALEWTPESFGNVHMLYIPIEINRIPLKAFVDSGAQTTIMSKRCAERCNLLRMMDSRFAGMARGVGTTKILGRIHMAQMKVGTTFIHCSLTVLESDGVDFLFGLDMLKRHSAVIDLGKNVLRLANEEISFLSEAEIPKDDIFLEKSEQKETVADENEEKLKKLMDLGFQRDKAVIALKTCQGNTDMAASLLFQGF